MFRVVPNCTAKIKGERQVYIADTVQSCPDLLSVVARRPVDRGYTVTWDLQRDIWLRCAAGRDLLSFPRGDGDAWGIGAD